MTLLDLDEPKRNQARTIVKGLLGALVAPAKPQLKPKRKRYMVRVQELQQWYQPMHVEVTARSREEAAAKGIRAVRLGEWHEPDGAAAFFEVDESNWARLQLDGVPDEELRAALEAAGVRMEYDTAAICVPSIRKVEVEELT